MKRILKIFGVLVLICFVCIAILFVLRAYNDHRYAQDLPKDTLQAGSLSRNSWPVELEGVEVKPLDRGRLQGFHLIPQPSKKQGIVICYGGSEGSPNYWQATRLAEEGYECLALYFFAAKHLPQSLVDIPLDQFDDVLSYLQEEGKMDEPLSVLGASKGAEFALNLALRYKEIDKLILISPASHSFEGLDFEHPGSSWTWRGEELPYINLRQGSLSAFFFQVILPGLTKAPISYAESYESARKADQHADEKRINIAHISAKILLIAGDDDQMWNSLAMGQDIKEQRPDSLLYVAKGAGHIFYGPGYFDLGKLRIKTGGTREANAKADAESRQYISEFLSSTDA